jgi:signal transduction histidine kinase
MRAPFVSKPGYRMSASSLLSKSLALLSALLLFVSTTLAYLLRRRSLELHALKNQAALDGAGDPRLADEQVARHMAHVAVLRQVAVALGATQESRQLLDTVVEAARAALGVAHASIGQIDTARGQLTIIAGSATSRDSAMIGLELPLSGGSDGQPWQLDAPLEIADPRHDQRLAVLHDLLAHRDASILLIVPLRAGGQLLGTLNLADTTARHFDAMDLDLAQALAGYAATVLDNQHLREAALQAERAKSVILDAVSHEFRTPITAVLGFTELYQEHVLGPVTEEQQEALEAIHRNAHRLLKLVDDLLDLARLEAGRLDMSLYPVEVGLCISDAAELLAAQFKQKQLDLRLEIADQLPLAWADAMWLRRVLVNLLANALRYTSTGAITVRAFESSLPHSRSADERCLMIEIEDTGRGIPEAEHLLIFDAFQRASGAQAVFPTSSGSGLGLAISKRAIDQMDGQLVLRSQPERGSIFTIVLHTAELAIEHPCA